MSLLLLFQGPAGPPPITYEFIVCEDATLTPALSCEDATLVPALACEESTLEPV